ncbi:MAG: oxidoreductase family protein [Granulosicoccus sp.]
MNNADGLSESSKAFIKQSLQANTFHSEEQIQSLWGEQGCIVRLQTDSENNPSAILKLISINQHAAHPRGWNTNRSFERKVRSYDVECVWYQNYARLCGEKCKVPVPLGVLIEKKKRLILLEDLSTDYPRICSQLNVEQACVCLGWLARFHAQFMSNKGLGLWDEGCYWHLDTRQDEYAAMEDGTIKKAARELDRRLRETPYQCLVHGDAKLANFCFSNDLNQVAAVDFQYVGRGCGMRDVAYFLGSCLTESECAQHEKLLLDHYFTQLNHALRTVMSRAERQSLEAQWRALYAIAWTDFYRFLLGWMPTHQKINSYTRLLAKQAISQL